MADDFNVESFPVALEFTAPPGPRMFSAAEFATRRLTPRPWLVPEIIPGAQVSTLDGDGGTGKSTLAQQLMVSAVSGRSWLGQQVAKGPAIYLSAEDDADEIHRRLECILVDYGLGFEALQDLHVWPLAENDPALVVADRDDTLSPTSRWTELVEAVAAIKPVVVVLDSRADVFGGNEVSRAQARGFISLLRQLAVRERCAVILLAHPSLTGMASGTGNSGSTHWRNSVRGALYLTRPNVEEGVPDPDARVLTVMKANYGPTGQSFQLRWSAGAFVLDGDATIAPVDRKQAAANADEVFLQILAAYTAQGRRVSDAVGAAYAPAIFAREPAAAGFKKAALGAAMNRLFGAGKIRIELIGPASKQRRQLVAEGGQ